MQEIKNLEKQQELFVSKEDSLAKSMVEALSNASIRTLGLRLFSEKFMTL
jgi:hypothetical protein